MVSLSKIYRSHTVLLITAVSVTALDLPQSQHGITAATTPFNLSSSELRLISSLSNSTKAPKTTPPLNLTVPGLSLAQTNEQIRCSYGHELIYNDCLDALNTFVYPADRELSIGQRAGGRPRWDLDLPIKWISGNIISM